MNLPDDVRELEARNVGVPSVEPGMGYPDVNPPNDTPMTNLPPSISALKRSQDTYENAPVKRPRLWNKKKLFRLERLNMAIAELEQRLHEPSREMTIEQALKHFNLNITIKEALASEERESWLAAIKKEHDGLMETGTFKEEVCPPHLKPIPTRVILSYKDYLSDNQTYKARLIVQGHRQDFSTFESTYAETAPAELVRMLLILSSSRDWELHQMDIKNAYLNARLNAPLYIVLPVDYPFVNNELM